MEVPLSEIIYREDLYPRIKSNPQVIQRYADNIEVLPPIEVNQNNILIDGFHRWTAHRKVEAVTINVAITETKSEAELYGLAIKRNANHGLQLSEADKKSDAIRLYNSGQDWSKKDIADILSVSLRTINNYLHDTDKQLRKERKQKIFDMWLACYTQQEIADSVGLTRDQVQSQIDTFVDFGNVTDLHKSLPFHLDKDFIKPLFNVWKFAKVSNKLNHFGRSEQAILDYLLYLYTKPFDIVLDPFAGGGATIDVCQYRLRRYWTSDRKPIVEREDEIRKLDITQELPPLNKRWSEAALTYLDPPYWRQAQGQYSEDKEDLANMSLEDFTKSMVNIIKQIASKQSKGVIAMLMQPTQWNADNREFTDHVFDIIQGVGNKKLTVENRVFCPYSTEQANAQMVSWAKENNKLLVISRELVIWKL